MTLSLWLTVTSILLLGAMSPGPSLALVLRHTLSGGRRNGFVVAIAHGFGIALYVFACISGLVVLITASPGIFRAFQWAGAIFLAWLGIRGLLAKKPKSDTLVEVPTTASAARDGFLVVFLNPNIAIFFLALFSQVIGSGSSWFARGVMTGTAWVIDTLWYALVAWIFSAPRWMPLLQKHAIWLERLFGLILLLLAARLVWQTLH